MQLHANDRIVNKYLSLRSRAGLRDENMRIVSAIRRGAFDEAFPKKYSSEWPKPTIANTIDVAARDAAEMLAPLPSFNCSSANMADETARRAADKRTRVARNYVLQSGLQTRMYEGCDRFVTYGFMPFLVELDFKKQIPVIRIDDPMGAYYEKNRDGDVIVYARRYYKTVGELVAQFPNLESHIRKTDSWGDAQAPDDAKLEVVYFSDAAATQLFLPERNGLLLQAARNPVGRCLVVVVERLGVDGNVRGQFDDVVYVQLARDKFASLALEAATKAVEAPLAVPMDTQELALGPDAIMRSNTPEKIRRVPIEMPASAFSQDQVLDRELRIGARYPESRTGNIDASVVTGQGVKALNLGFDSQLKAYQALLADGLGKVLGMCFEVDEKLWPNVEKTFVGNDKGTPYELKYRAAKVIKGVHTVDVQYGLMAGLDPNRALVFGLQARSDKLISRDTLRRQMPWDVSVEDEERMIGQEELRDALGQAMAAYAQSIPMMAQQGMDPMPPTMQIAKVIKAFRNGTPIEDAVVVAFTPPEPPPGMETESGELGSATPGAPGSDAGSGGPLPGQEMNGLPEGVAPGQAAMGPGGRPDLAYLLAGLSSSGKPNMSANIVKRRPI